MTDTALDTLRSVLRSTEEYVVAKKAFDVLASTDEGKSLLESFLQASEDVHVTSQWKEFEAALTFVQAMKEYVAVRATRDVLSVSEEYVEYETARRASDVTDESIAYHQALDALLATKEWEKYRIACQVNDASGQAVASEAIGGTTEWEAYDAAEKAHMATEHGERVEDARARLKQTAAWLANDAATNSLIGTRDWCSYKTALIELESIPEWGAFETARDNLSSSSEGVNGGAIMSHEGGSTA